MANNELCPESNNAESKSIAAIDSNDDTLPVDNCLDGQTESERQTNTDEKDVNASNTLLQDSTYQTSCCRTRINANDEFWQRMTPLKDNSRTAGVIPRLEPHFTNLHRDGDTSAVYLCNPKADHVATGLMDLGWGCGYRNCQMLMTFLERQKEDGDQLLKQVSNIAGLQILLENAWNEGFDPEGADQLKHRVYKTRKWIGTTEVHVMLTYLGIRSTILDFHQPTANNTHDVMFDWIQSYFEKATSYLDKENKIVHITNRPPLYLQHAGHSRTVIGIELLKSGKRNLIMFDPGRRMLRTYRTKPTANTPTTPEDDIEQSALPFSASDDTISKNESSQHETDESLLQNLASRFLSYFTFTPLPANMLRPFRVDARTVEKNKQYQLLVLGQVMGDTTKERYMCWNEEKGYLLDDQEREAMKRVTSLVGAAPL